MGLEMVHQALPPDHDVLARARLDPVFGERLQFLPGALRSLAAGRAPTADDLVDACTALLRETPDLPALAVDHDRDWGLAAALLERICAHDDALLAVRGEAPLARGVCASQGAPLMWTSQPAVARVAALLLRIVDDEVRAAFDAEELEESGTYKLVAGRDDDGRLRAALAAIAGLRHLYAVAAARGFGVLVVVD